MRRVDISLSENGAVGTLKPTFRIREGASLPPLHGHAHAGWRRRLVREEERARERLARVHAILLEIDHTLGLMLLREATARVPVYAPAGVSALLYDYWPLFRVLEAYAGVDARSLPDGDRVTLRDGAGRDLGLQCTARSMARRPPRYARDAPIGSCEVGLRLEDRRSRGTFAYIPTAGAVDEAVRALASGVDLLCFDGTFWSDDELHAAGIDAPRASAMGHLPVGGPDGSLAALPALGAKRSVLIHINNTNPILDPASRERAQVLAAGLEVGEDGMEFEL